MITEAWKNWHTHTHTQSHTHTTCMHAQYTTPHHTTPPCMHARTHTCTHACTHTHTPCSYLTSLFFFSHLDATIPMQMQIAKCQCRRSKMLALCPTGVVQWKGGLHPNVLHCGGADWIISLSERLPQWPRQPTVVYS